MEGLPQRAAPSACRGRSAMAACRGRPWRLPLAAGRPQGGRAAALRPGGAARSCRVDSAGSWPGRGAGWRRRRRWWWRRRRVPRCPPRHGFHGEAAGRQGAAGRHGAADSADRGEPEPALPHGERRPAGPRGRREGSGEPRGEPEKRRGNRG